MIFDMALFEVKDYDKKVYEEELKDFLPDKILDVHTHVWLDAVFCKYRAVRPQNALHPDTDSEFTAARKRDNTLPHARELISLEAE